MRLQIEDGYTIEAATLADVPDRVTGQPVYRGLPVVNFRYRPALPDALAEWRYQLRTAAGGKAELDATAKLVADHLASWDVTDGKGQPLPVTADNVRRIPEPILNQLLDAVTTWAPREMAAAAGNSPAG